MKTILVVEDFMAVQEFLREMLESKGYRTLGANNGNNAFEVLTSSKEVDLVLTDYHMPNSNGFDLLKKIKSLAETSGIPIIFLTAETDPEIIKKCQALGCTGWIRKPYRAEVLFDEIKRAFPENGVQWSVLRS